MGVQADRLHYLGHGNSVSFYGIKISEARANILCTDPMTFIALDGCKTAENTDMLGGYTCYWKQTTKLDLDDRGLIPGFGCGWKNVKNAAWLPTQGALILNHYDFWVDFYGLDGGLTHREPLGHYMDKTYEEAYEFAKNPAGGGVDQNRQTNPEADGFVRVGCQDCFFDL